MIGMQQTIRWWLLGFLCGALLAVWIFFGRQDAWYNLYASILGGPGMQQWNLTYDVALHGDEESMWLVSHRDFSQAESLSLLILHDEWASVKLVTRWVEEEREDGVVQFTMNDVSSLDVEDEIIRWSYAWKKDSLVLSDVEVFVQWDESEFLSVYNTMVCLWDECSHDHGNEE
jgi:hypothetical protein